MSAADNVYDVEAIIGYRYNTNDGCDEFLIKWVDIGDEGNSWESASNLAGPTLELARTYQADMDSLPQQTSTYRRQARKLLMNSFQRVSCAAIDQIFSMCKYNFTRSYHYLAEINNHCSNEGNGVGQFVLIPKSVKVFIKRNRAKDQLELSDETLLDEINDIPALNTKEGKTATNTEPNTVGTIPIIDLTTDSDEEDEDMEEKRECLCCFDDYPVSKLRQCSAGDGHYVCRQCINRYVSEQLDGNGSTTFQCIASAECSCQYTLAFLDQVLSPTLKKRTNETVALEEIKKAGVDDASYWSCPKCAYMGFLDGLHSSIHCPQCNVPYCTRCNVSHDGSSCEEYQRQQAVGKDPKLLAAEAMSRACKRSCPHCGQKFMKADGCNKITCNRCKKFSCYLCGEKVNNSYSHFCRTRKRARDSNSSKCPLRTSPGEMERIDRRKRQKAGREVLLEQGITDEEEIAAILNSLGEEEDNQSVDTAAAVHRGRAGNQGQRAPRFRAGPGHNLVARPRVPRPRNVGERPNANQPRRNEFLARFRRMGNVRGPAPPAPLRNQNAAVVAAAPRPPQAQNQNEGGVHSFLFIFTFLVLDVWLGLGLHLLLLLLGFLLLPLLL